MPRTRRNANVANPNAETDQQDAPSPLDALHNFGNPLMASRWTQFYKRPIVTGHSVVLEEEDDDELQALLYDRVLGMGWGAMMFPSSDVYPRVVRLFYNNPTMELDDDGVPVIQSYVLGKAIRIDRAYLKDVCEFDDGDLMAYFSTDTELKQSERVSTAPVAFKKL